LTLIKSVGKKLPGNIGKHKPRPEKLGKIGNLKNLEKIRNIGRNWRYMQH
jgi:hypothetical protein